MTRIEPTLNQVDTLADYERELARVNRDIRILQQQMGIEPQTLEQRAKSWAERQAPVEQSSRSRPSWMNRSKG